MEGKGEGEDEPQRGGRAAFAIGATAMLVGALLLVVAARQHADRPQVLGETIVAETTTTTTTTTDAVPANASSTTATSRATTPTTRRSTTTTTDALSSSTTSSSTTSSSTTSSSTTSTTERGATTTSSSTTSTPCPGGAPVAEVRSWEAAADSDGVWHVIVTGVVTNRTGATVQVDSVAVAFSRDGGTPYRVPDGEWPAPSPRVIADGAQATWRFEGAVPAGGEPTNAYAAVGGWHWVGTC